MHFSYRGIACYMKQRVEGSEPELGNLIEQRHRGLKTPSSGKGRRGLE